MHRSGAPEGNQGDGPGVESLFCRAYAYRLFHIGVGYADDAGSRFLDRKPERLCDLVGERLERRLNVEGHFAAGESIHTENSYKYDVPEFAAMSAAAGFRPGPAWFDDDRHFCVQLFER